MFLVSKFVEAKNKMKKKLHYMYIIILLFYVHIHEGTVNYSTGC